MNIKYGIVSWRVGLEKARLRDVVFYRSQTFIIRGPLPPNPKLHPDCYWMILE